MKKKKYLGIATAVLIAVGSAFSSTVAVGIIQEDQVEASTIKFKDVTDSKKWYYTPVYWAANNGIVTGTNGYFYPANNCTREQSITMLWRMAGKPEPKSMTSKFSDVKNKSLYSYKAIMWGSEQGLILGVNGKFNPKGVCTREQIVTMLWRWAGKPLPKSSASKFTDVKKNYAYNAILWANEKGIANGSKGKFSPSANCKRQDIVTFLYRYDKTKYATIYIEGQAVKVPAKGNKWVSINGYFHFVKDGKMIKGWRKLTAEDGESVAHTSYFDTNNGRLQTGRMVKDGTLYVIDNRGWLVATMSELWQEKDDYGTYEFYTAEVKLRNAIHVTVPFLFKGCYDSRYDDIIGNRGYGLYQEHTVDGFLNGEQGVGPSEFERNPELIKFGTNKIMIGVHEGVIDIEGCILNSVPKNSKSAVYHVIGEKNGKKIVLKFSDPWNESIKSNNYYNNYYKNIIKSAWIE